MCLFEKKLPKTSLVRIEDIRCVCPDATHMITRCVETDLRKMAQKLIDDMHPHEMFALQRFEENLTKRWAKEPFPLHHCLNRRKRQSWQSGCSLSF